MFNWIKRHKVPISVAGIALLPVAAYAIAISGLTALTGANLAGGDHFVVVDISETVAADRTKRITRDELGIGLSISGSTGFVLESAPGTAPTATGTDAAGIGDGAVAGDAAGDNGVLAFGARSTATGVDAIAMGENSDATGSGSIAIGGSTTDADSADATGAQSIALGGATLADATANVAIGDAAEAITGAAAIAIGQNADASGNSSIAIGGNSIDGNSADASGSQSISLGFSTLTDQTGNVAIGGGAEAITGAAAIAFGQNVDATGANCVALGGNATDADSADCSAADSVAIGQHILADDIGEFAFASGEFAAQSDAHTSVFVLRNSTTDATQTELFADGSAGDISVPSDCTVSFRANVVARQTDADGVSAGYLISGVIDNNAGTTALVGSVSVVTVGEDVAGWSVTATADDTNDGINVLVTGAVGDAVRWVARTEIAEVCG